MLRSYYFQEKVAEIIYQEIKRNFCGVTVEGVSGGNSGLKQTEIERSRSGSERNRLRDGGHHHRM